MVKFAGENQNQPLYDQLVILLKKKIDNELTLGQMLPTERELALQYNLSRTTVRIALQKLESLGYVERVQGRGTFVSHAKDINQSNQHSYSVEEQLSELGKDAQSEVLGIKVIHSNAFFKEKFPKASNDKLLEIARMWRMDELPILFEKTYLVYDEFKDIPLTDFEEKQAFTIFSEKQGNTISYVQDSVRYMQATTELSEIMTCDKTTPLMEMTRSYINKSNEVISLVISVARAEYYQFKVSYKLNEF